MRTKMIAGLLTGTLLFALCMLGGYSGVTSAATAKENPNLQTVVAGNSEFAFDLYRTIGQSTTDKNVFFSPFSISTALSMTYAGARENTAKQMADTMYFKLTQSDLHPAVADLSAAMNADGKGYKLDIANALWGQQGYPFQPKFLELIKKHYGGGFNTVDFAGQTETSRMTINSWVEQHTNNKIKDLLQQGSLNALTRLVLTNAIYFKGDWASKFKKENTKPAPFHVRPGETVDVQMMRQSGNFRFAETDGIKVLEMPYVGGDLSMIILLPTGGTTEFDKVVAPARLKEWLAQARDQDIDIFLPRFKFEAKYELQDLLSEMGMIDAFNVSTADFSGIDGRKALFITKVIHKAVIEVNEEGSEAAAATAVVIGLKSVMQKPEFKADRPFLFLIRHNATGSILFLGRVTQPEYK